MRRWRWAAGGGGGGGGGGAGSWARGFGGTWAVGGGGVLGLLTNSNGKDCHVSLFSQLYWSHLL